MGKLKDKIKGFLKKGEHVTAKISMWPSRGGFLLATKTNLFKLAKRLKQAHDKDPELVEKFWYQFGGEYKNLAAEIEKGLKHMAKHQAKKDARHHVSGCIGAIDESSIYGVSELGEPYTIAAIVAAATPILTAVAKVFNKTKSDKPGDNEHDKENLTKLANQLLKGGSVGVKIVSTDKDGKETVIDKGKEPKNNTLLYLGGAAALVGGYFLFKKKH